MLEIQRDSADSAPNKYISGTRGSGNLGLEHCIVTPVKGDNNMHLITPQVKSSRDLIPGLARLARWLQSC